MKKKGSLGMLFWLAVVLLVVAVFLYNRRNIENVLASTGLVEQIRNRFGRQTIELVYSAPTAAPLAADDMPAAPQLSDQLIDVLPDASVPIKSADPSTELEPSQSEQGSAGQPNSVSEATTENEAQEATDIALSTLTAEIFFIRVDDNGIIQPTQVNRTLRRTSPMRHSIEALLQGPTTAELDAGLLNLIPENTQLLSATIREGVVYLNFNDAFRFNPLGTEGTLAQLQQIVYSATGFDTIDRVQILIEGVKEDFLGSESVYIGVPLNRQSFS